MPIQGQVLIVVFALSMLAFVLALLVRRKISEATTLWWLLIIIAIIIVTVYQPLLLAITHFTGALIPISAITLISLFFVLIMLIYFSMKISVLSSQVKDLSQYIALLKEGNNKK